MPQHRTTAQLALILGTLTAFGPLSIDMYLPGLPAIAREFGTDTASAQLTLAVFFVGMALGQAFYGPIADRVGRRRPLLFGCGLFAAASIACALAPTLSSLVALRFVQAIGGCAGVVLARSVVRDLFDERESARMYSFLMLVMGLAPITAPLIGGQLLVAFGWRAIFFALSAFGLLCMALVLALPETLPAERRAPSSLRSVLAVYGGLLAEGHFLAHALASGLALAAMFAYISGSPFVFIELHGVPPERYGLLFGLNALGLIAASQLNRGLLARFASRAILRAALAVHAVAGLLLLLAATAAWPFPALLAVLFVSIASTGLVQPNALAIAMAPHGRVAGSAAALMGAIQFAVGAGAGAAVSALHNGTAVPMATVIAVCGVAGLTILILARLAEDRRRAAQAAGLPAERPDV